MTATDDVTRLVNTAATELTIAHLMRTAPRLERIRPAVWAHACQQVLDQGNLDAGLAALDRVAAAFPGLQSVAVLRHFATRPVVGEAPLLPLAFDPKSDLQVLPRPGSDCALVVFCDSEQRVTLPVVLSHRWLGRVPASLIYLRDSSRMLGAGGFPSLGPDREASIIGLQAVLRRLGARRIAVLGTSGGVFPALYYGAALGAESALCLAGPTDLSEAFNRHVETDRSFIWELIERYPDYAVNVGPVVAAAGAPRQVTLFYGAENRRDQAYADRLAASARAELVSLVGFDGHDVLLPLIASGDLDRRLVGLFAIPP